MIPNLNKETKRVPISSVVFSSQRVDTSDALYNATNGKEQTKDDAENPLVQEGLKLIPSVTRVFSGLAKCMCTCRPMMAARLPRHRLPLPQSRFTADCVCEPLSGRQKGIRICAHRRNAGGREPARRHCRSAFKIGLGDLAPGEYQCQISVLDPSGHRVAFWVNPIMLVK